MITHHLNNVDIKLVIIAFIGVDSLFCTFVSLLYACMIQCTNCGLDVVRDTLSSKKNDIDVVFETQVSIVVTESSQFKNIV